MSDNDIPAFRDLLRDRRRLRDQIWTELWAISVGGLINQLLASDFMPRPLRVLGYRALGMRTQTANIFPGLRVAGSLRNVSIGSGTFINRECLLEAVGPVSIGRGCQLGPQVALITSHHSWTPDGKISRVSEGRAVRIGDRVWLGARSMVLPGVTIGDDVAIAAGAVVTKDCREPGLYAGVPARWRGGLPTTAPVGVLDPAEEA
jgi:maltose O-acetyltransferase